MEAIEQYIMGFEEAKQKVLQEIYRLIKENIPAETTEKLSWGMPTFQLHGNLVHFAMNKKHLGFYPGESGVEFYLKHFEPQYKYSKGAIQFPLNEPLPKELIIKIVKFRVRENLEK